MAKVYLVTSGEYSDKTIDAVYSSREKAEQYIIPNSRFYYIEEMDLDPDVELKVSMCIYMDFHTGKFLGGGVGKYFDGGDFSLELYTDSIVDSDGFRERLVMTLRTVREYDDRQAAKVANEKRMLIKAQNPEIKTGFYDYQTGQYLGREKPYCK